MFVETGYHADTEVKADPFKLESLIGWLETKNPEEAYAYNRNESCCLAQYFQANGYPEAFVTPSDVYLNGYHGGLYSQDYTPLPTGFNRIAAQHDRTFGGALERAKAFAAG